MNKLLLALIFYVPVFLSPQEISFSVANPTLKVVVNEIESQTDFKFAYGKEIDLVRELRGTYEFKNEDIRKVVKELSNRTPYTFTILRNNITITEDPETIGPIKKGNTEGAIQMNVKGNVSDTYGVALGGVSILEEGTVNGTLSDFDGNYSLEVSSSDAVLIFSYVGMKRTEITVGDQTTINVVMDEDLEQLDEVVITSLGISKAKKSLTYAVSEVAGDDMTKAREINVGNALSGRVAGVTVSSTSGGPSASSRVIIRGNGSLNGNNQPLYVVNGMPITNENTSTPGTYGGVDRGDGLSSINPDDIKSISVLKGGTAAALYGARAANGVVLITTKSGMARQGIGVEYRSNFTMDQPIDLLDWQYQYGSGSQGQAPTTQAEAIAFGRTSWGSRLNGSPVIQPDGGTRPYSAVRNNIDNFYQTGSTISNTLALNGGNESINFRFAASNMDNKGIVPNNTMNRKTFNLSLNAALAEKITFQANVQYSLEEVENRTRPGDFDRNPNAGAQLIATNIDVRTLAPGYSENGNEFQWSDYIYVTNPYFVVNKVRNGDTRKRLIGSFNTTYNITENLYARARVGIDQMNTDGFYINPTGLAYQATGSMTTDQGLRMETNLEAILGFNKESDHFSINVLAGGNQMRNTFDGINLASGNFNLPNQYFIGNGSSQTFEINYAKYGINSLFASADIGFNDYLFLTLSGRNDWFSTLAIDDNSLFYPSAGLSFLASEVWEAMPSWMDYVKLRTSWAQVGGGAPSPYAIQKSYSAQAVQYAGQTLTNVSSATIPSALTPYTSTTLEAGIDMRFFENRLGVDLTLYDRTTTDDIVNASIAPSSSYTNVAINVGEMKNRGIELMLTGKPLPRSDNGLNWDMTLNMAYNENEVIKISDDLDRLMLPGAQTRTLNGAIYHFEGMPFGMIAGNRRVRDANGDIVYNSTSGLPVAGTLEALGRGVPPLAVGFGNNFSYKDFSMSFLLDSRWGGSIYSATNAYGTDFGLHQRTVANGVRENGIILSGVDQNGDPYSTTRSAQDYYRGIAYSITEDFVQKADFIKLRSFTVGYNFPSSILDKTPFKSASLSLVGRNLLILYKTTDNIDPESNYSSGNGQGLENFGLPTTRSYGFDLNVKF
ncbi:MAG: SusC/RagA family TonB-linked outer membrane protein [Sediminicola sp.]